MATNPNEILIEEPAPLLRPENNNKKYESLFLDIDLGRIKLPMFQREFVWDKEQSSKLIDSILKGYPVGTFIFWKTRESLRSVKEIGHHPLPETPKGDYAEYILDGQQRITSLYAIRKGIRITKDGREINYRDIYIDLDYDARNDEQIVVSQKQDERTYVSVHDLLTKSMLALFAQAGADKGELIESYKTKLTTYDFPTISIRDYPIDVACDVFARINTGGKPLTLFEIMVAMTYDEKKGFDLALKYDELLNGSDEKENSLSKARFETIPASTILQAIGAIAVESVRAKDILKIRRDEFIDTWAPMEASMFSAVDFIRTNLRVPVSQLLPYPSLLVPLAFFFHKNKQARPTVKQAALLTQFFYWVGWSNRYSGATETAIGDDLKRMSLIVKGTQPSYPSDELAVSAKELSETWFSATNSSIKSILCMYASLKPRNFDDDSEVLLDNTHLRIASSKNYHHFFPKAWLRRNMPDEDANLIGNITLIDAASNNKIRAKAPSFYIGQFKEANPKLGSSLASHLIGSPQEFGITADDYKEFIAKRSEAIAEHFNSLLNP